MRCMRVACWVLFQGRRQAHCALAHTDAPLHISSTRPTGQQACPALTAVLFAAAGGGSSRHPVPASTALTAADRWHLLEGALEGGGVGIQRSLQAGGGDVHVAPGGNQTGNADCTWRLRKRTHRGGGACSSGKSIMPRQWQSCCTTQHAATVHDRRPLPARKHPPLLGRQALQQSCIDAGAAERAAAGGALQHRSPAAQVAAEGRQAEQHLEGGRWAAHLNK